MDYWSDFIGGTGAAINVEIGFIPDSVRVTNMTDKDTVVLGVTNTILNFDNGDHELKSGDLIVGHSAKAQGLIKKVVVTAGSWGGSTKASGFIVLEHEERSGTFADNDNIQVAVKGNYGAPPVVSSTVSAIVNGAALATNLHIDGSGVSASASNETVAAYDGTSAGAGQGVTLGSAVSEDNDVLFVEAWRSGPS